MSSFPIHTLESAPAASRAPMQNVQAALGMVPNLAAGMAESPTLFKGFFTLREIYEQGTLTPVDIQALSLVNAMENGCDWCVAFHSTVGLKVGLPDEALQRLRAGGTSGNARLDALVNLSRALIRNRGRVGEDVLKPFYAAGFTPSQALEVVLGVGFSTLANYAGHLIHPPLDAAFEGQKWSAK